MAAQLCSGLLATARLTLKELLRTIWMPATLVRRTARRLVAAAPMPPGTDRLAETTLVWLYFGVFKPMPRALVPSTLVETGVAKTLAPCTLRPSEVVRRTVLVPLTVALVK